MQSPGMHPPVRSRFATTDPARGRELIASAYASNRMRIRGATEDFRLEHTRDDLGPIRLDTVRYSMCTDFDLDPTDALLMCRFHGAVEVETEHVTRRYERGDVCLIALPDQSFQVRIFGTDIDVVGLDPALLRALAESPDDDPIRRLRSGPLPQGWSQHWQNAVDYVSGIALNNDETAVGPLVLGTAARLLAATLQAACGSDTPARPADRPDAHPATIRRAIAFIDANPHRDIAVSDIAAASFVTVRAVQLAFRRHLNTTPMAYLRQVRLTCAHQELLATDPTRTTVTAIANRWGFANPGRFAALYRVAYGRPPSHTLHR